MQASDHGPAPWEESDRLFASRNANDHATHLLPHLKPGQAILDIGCGLGSISQDLAGIVAPAGGTVLGLDPDTRTIGLAREHFSHVPNLKFDISNVFDLAHLHDETFDIIHAHQVMLHLTEPTRAIRELRRLLKKGGILSLRDSIDVRYVPESDILYKQWNWFESLAKSKGTDLHGGLRHHVWTHNAGFSWHNIQTGIATVEHSGKAGRELMCAGARNGFRALAMKLNLATNEELDEITKAWDEWAKDEAGRAIHVDSTLLAWKE